MPEILPQYPESEVMSVRSSESDLSEIINSEEIPMSDVPFGLERVQNIQDSDRFVSKHEFGHAYVAMKKGFYVEKLSVVPEPGKYRGVCIIRNALTDLRGFQVVSAAGAAAVGSFEGAGSDFNKIRYIHQNHNGHHENDAYSEAQLILSEISDDEWRVIEEIIAYKKELSGLDIPRIISRARFEVNHLLTKEDISFTRHVKNIEQESKRLAMPEVEIVHRYEELEDGFIRKYQEINGEADKSTEEIYCAKCRKSNGHTVDCTNNQSNVIHLHTFRQAHQKAA